MMFGLLIQIVIVLIIAGLALWIVQQIPMDPAISRIIRVVVIVAIAIWLIYVLLGLLPATGLLHR